MGAPLKHREGDQQANFLIYRQRVLPDKILSAERKLRALYQEAQSYRMTDLVTYPVFINEAWDREVAVAKLEAARRDGCP